MRFQCSIEINIKIVALSSSISYVHSLEKVNPDLQVVAGFDGFTNGKLNSTRDSQSTSAYRLAGHANLSTLFVNRWRAVASTASTS